MRRTGNYQPVFGLRVSAAGQVQLFNSTLNVFQALAPGTGIALSSSSDGKTATIATTGLQSALTFSSPLSLTGNVLSIASGAYQAPITTVTPCSGQLQLFENKHHEDPSATGRYRDVDEHQRDHPLDPV